jgi:hypothetical protein
MTQKASSQEWHKKNCVTRSLWQDVSVDNQNCKQTKCSLTSKWMTYIAKYYLATEKNVWQIHWNDPQKNYAN